MYCLYNIENGLYVKSIIDSISFSETPYISKNISDFILKQAWYEIYHNNNCLEIRAQCDDGFHTYQLSPYDKIFKNLYFQIHQYVSINWARKIYSHLQKKHLEQKIYMLVEYETINGFSEYYTSLNVAIRPLIIHDRSNRQLLVFCNSDIQFMYCKLLFNNDMNIILAKKFKKEII